MTRAILVSILLCCALHARALAATSAPPLPRDIRTQLSLPESRLDIGTAALVFARAIYPGLDLQAYSARLDLMAGQVRQLVGDSQDPELRIRALNTVIYLREGIRYDHSPEARGRRDNYFLNGILDSRRGICYTMPLLYMAVAQRLGYPVHAVAAPDHIFLRYSSPGFREQNIEATSGGHYQSDAHYIRNFAVSQKGLESGSYLRTLGKREFLAYLLAVNALFQPDDGAGTRALPYLEKAVELDPRHADHYDRLQAAYTQLALRARGGQAVAYRKRAIEYAHKARVLGYVHPDAIIQARRLGGR